MLACPRCRSIYRARVRRCGIDGTELVERDTDPLVGATLDRYRIIERLAEGSMGSVYRAAHTVLDHRYALKVLFGDYGAQQSRVERFRREAISAARIQHPSVVSVLDFGATAEGLRFMVMELVEGRTLELVMNGQLPFTPPRVAAFARQIAGGLAAAHRLGFVHRDVKPANVMVAENGGIERIKILDFGVARQTLSVRSTHLTGSGLVVGTPVYMAPEQAEDGMVTLRADLYSLGVILYEMLSGKPPFDHANAANVLLHHITQAPPPLAPCGGLERLVKRLLAKRPEERPSSAEEVALELDRLGLAKEAARDDLIADLDLSVSTAVTVAPEVYAVTSTRDLDPFVPADPLMAGFMGTGPATEADPVPFGDATYPDPTEDGTLETDLSAAMRGAIIDDTMEPTDSLLLEPPTGALRSREVDRHSEKKPTAPLGGRKPRPRPETMQGFAPWTLSPRPAASTSYAFAPSVPMEAPAARQEASAASRRRLRWLVIAASIVVLAAVISYVLTV